MKRKEQFFEWLRKDNWYKLGSADALMCRIQFISHAIRMNVYGCSSIIADMVRQAILDGKLLDNLDKKQRNEYAVSLSRYSAFAVEFPFTEKLDSHE